MLKKLCWFGLLLIGLVGCGLLQVDTAEEVIPTLVAEAPPDHAAETLNALQSADPPARDLADLAKRLKGVAVSPVAPATRSVGEVETFWYLDGGDKNMQTSAELRLQSDNLSLWIEEGARVSDSDLAAALIVLDEEIVPTNRAFFGHEIDTGGDSRINILHLESIGGNGGNTVVAGYFSSADFYPKAANEFSNERKMLYISLSSAPIGSESYYQVIAHELEHMIQATVDRNEVSWVDEGMAELAAYVNGYNEVDSVDSYLRLTDVQLNDWSNGSAEDLAHYGASFLFNAYFLDRFGEDAMKQLVQQEGNGLSGVDAVLQSIDSTLTVGNLFADWVAATYLTGIGRQVAPYSYGAVEIGAVELAADHDAFPVAELGAVNQYGTDYVRIESAEPVQFTFTGSQQSRLLPTDPFSGDYFVTTYPADRSDMMMTGAFDLTDVDADDVTLTFATWYQIEKGWDYGYVLVSADNGATWQTLPSIYTTEANPHGNNYGVGLTGKSGLESDSVWTDVNIDLSEYKGKSILVRFEYITDDAVFEAGWAIDDIRIPAIDYVETFEDGLGDWELLGWARHSNILPQSFILQAIYLGETDVRIEPLALDINQQGSFTLALNDEFNAAVVTISGSTPVTKQPSAYRYTLSDE